MKKINLNDGCKTLVDDKDYENLTKYSWICDRHRYCFRSYKVNGKTKHIYLHRWLLEPNKNQQVDHINNNGLDNRRDNIRVCTPRQNNYNMSIRKDNKSGYKGVYYSQVKNKWVAQIMPDNGKRKHLGVFDDAENAAYVYDQFAQHLYGNFAKTNLL